MKICLKTSFLPYFCISLLKKLFSGEKPHGCAICGKMFSTSSSLNTHVRIHTGERPHECPMCGKRFTASSNLYYHRMTHYKVVFLNFLSLRIITH